MKNPTVLGAYLAKKRMSQADFARLMDRHGQKVSEALVSMWVNGRRKPNRTNALAIERATEGDVPAESWDAPIKKGRRGRIAHSRIVPQPAP